ncbi:MAG: hypothetical protein ACYTAN_16765 [Planctomycetota bacterium]
MKRPNLTLRSRIVIAVAAIALIHALFRWGPGYFERERQKAWPGALRTAVTGCDMILARTGGTCHRSPENERTLFEILEPGEIVEFLDKLEIDEREYLFRCECCGDATFEFYRAEDLIAALSFHHGVNLRWQEGWPGDARLAPENSAFYCDLLASHGFTGPKTDYERRMRASGEDRRTAEPLSRAENANGAGSEEK